MAEKQITKGETPTQENPPFIKKERFEFKLTVNDNIICQRYFRINGFRRESYGSMELIYAIDKCVELINNDLRDKTIMFYNYTAPMVFKTVIEMEDWCKRPSSRTENPVFMLCKETDTVKVFNNGVINDYNKPFNKMDYLNDKTTDNPCVLKFSMLDFGREVCSKIWDGNVYPRFIRSNIDLSNSRNKYKFSDVFAPMECFMIDRFNETHTDLIPQLVRELCNACSLDEEENYTTTMSFGSRTYNLDTNRADWKYIKSLELKYKKKTDKYFSRI